MANLGALLLKGFQKKSKISKKVKTPPLKRKLKLLRSALNVQDQSFKNKKKQTTQKVLTPQELQPLQIVEEETMDHSLQSSDLVSPGNQLKASIHSFLQDLRSPHTRRAYEKDLKRFVKYLVERKSRLGPESLNRSHIIGYKDYLLSEKLLHTTIDRHLATLRSFFRWLVEDGVLTKNIAENVRFLNPKRESTTIGFSDEEVVQVLKLPNLHLRVGSLHYAVLMVLFYCGLRRSELCSLKTSSFGFERGHHFIRLKGKGNVERIVVLLTPVWNAIQHYLKMTNKSLNHDEFLFTPVRNNRTGVSRKAIDPSMVFYIVTRYAKLAGIKNRVSPHSCRATAISNARDHNVPDRAIQEFAGWATTTMITRYDKRKTALEKSAVHSISYGEKERPLPVTTNQNGVLKK